MEYRADFILGIFSQIIWYASNYLIVWLLLNNFHSISGWTWPEMAFLISINILTYAIGASFTYTPMMSMEQLVIKGELDKYLVKPISIFPHLIASLFNFGYIAHILISGALLIWCLEELSIVWNSSKVFYLILTLAGGSMLQAGGLILIGSWSFYFMKSSYLAELYFKIKDFISYPISVYVSVIQVFLTWVLPLAFINYYPALYLLGKDTNLLLLFAPLVGPLVLLVSIFIWKKGLNNYQSSGS
ncbi:ABC transporter permease [Paenibacillus taiwanensis]|uniref:ABC transporter permease n=1 Tax=Paenibacillus taiwanensis TaxID=401638 RepID=UPI00068616DB|nr:ABC-2 family transporter protein [Paenibacillus taiwanensis]